MTDDFYSVEQVAERLGLHVRTVRTYIRDGRLKAVRIGKQYRIARGNLEALTGQAAVEPAAEAESRRSHVEVSSIVQIDEIGPDAASRLSVLLTAGANVPRDAPGPLRIQTIHDEERARMKIVILGGVADTAELLHLLDGVLGPENGMFLSGSGSGSGEVRGG
jgi:excisionase family DNA binding protein